MKKCVLQILFACFLSGGSSSCVTTPLPVPPTISPRVHPELIEIEEGGGFVTIIGSDGAIEPPGADIRITSSEDPTDSGPQERVELTVGEDGTFTAQVLGFETSVFYFEFLLEDEDLFVMAITEGDDSSGTTIEAAPGPDSDSDGSPDWIDCAPLDETLGGRRCF